MEFLKKNILLLSTIGYSLGFFLHNIYLSKYGIYEFEIIQIRYIYSLITMLVFVIVLVFIMTFGLNLSEHKKNLSLKNSYMWFCRVFLYATIIYTFLDMESYKEIINIGLYGQVLPLSLILISAEGISNSTKPNYIISLIKYLYIVITPFYIAYLCYIAMNYEPYREGIMFFMTIWLAVYIGSIIFIEKEENKTEYPAIDNSTKKETKDLYNEYFIYFGLVFYVFLFIILYSNSLYNKIPISLGGAKPIVMKIVLNDKTELKGKVLEKTSDWIYILQKGKIVKQIKIEDVNFIEMKYK